MRELNIDEVKQIQLSILSKVASFCDKHELKYSIAAGTLIGAVRHKGYIPWDDDIDIMMPRQDYERLMSELNDDTLVVFNHNNYRKYNYPFAKIGQKNTKLVELDYDYSQYFGINIDVFPIDGFPESNNDIQRHRNRIIHYRRILSLKLDSKLVGRGVLRKTAIKIIRSFYSYKYINKKITSIARSLPFGKTKFSGVSVWGYGDKEICPTNIYYDYIDIEFEGLFFKAIADYDTYLTTVYGNYMKLPPEDQRVQTHNFVAYEI